MLLEMGVRVWLPGTAFAQAPASVSTAGASGQAGPPAAPVRGVAASNRAEPVQAGPAEKPPLVSVDRVAATQPQARTSLDVPADWPALQEAVAGCRACVACAGRKQAAWQAPAVPHADWMVVGDPPDEDEDAAGLPFAGDSGELLANMLKALGLVRINPCAVPQDQPLPTREQAAYVTGVMKCRNNHGAVPQAQDLAQCSSYLQREIALVQPRMILAMGRFANQILLGEDPALVAAPLGRLRGSVHRFSGVPVVVTYHPKALLRNTADKAKAWADLCLAADTLEAVSTASR